jgi:hypothetical protein
MAVFERKQPFFYEIEPLWIWKVKNIKAKLFLFMNLFNILVVLKMQLVTNPFFNH